MNDKNIGTGTHYLSIPQPPYFKKQFSWKVEDYPNVMKIGRQTTSLPLSSKISDNDVERVTQTLMNILV